MAAAMRWKGWGHIRRPRWGILIPIGLAVVAYLLLLAIVPDLISRSEPVEFWVQTFSGNWSPIKDAKPVSEFQYSLAASIALLLNTAQIVAILLAAWKILTKEGNYMRVADAVGFRDRLIKEEIYNVLDHIDITDDMRSSLIKSIEKSFEDGTVQWEESLSQIIEKNMAKQIVETVVKPKKPVLSPSQASHPSPTGP